MAEGLFVFLEGPDDARFIGRIIYPIAVQKYKWVGNYEYARKKPRQVCGCLTNLLNIDADYIFLADKNQSPCISHRIPKVIERFPAVKQGHIVIVVAEIEAWYIAGLTNQSASELGIQLPPRTEHVTKEEFDLLRPRVYDSRIDFMIEILKLYSIDVARQRNRSFDYMMQKLLG